MTRLSNSFNVYFSCFKAVLEVVVGITLLTTCTEFFVYVIGTLPQTQNLGPGQYVHVFRLISLHLVHIWKLNERHTPLKNIVCLLAMHSKHFRCFSFAAVFLLLVQWFQIVSCGSLKSHGNQPGALRKNLSPSAPCIGW